MALYQIGDPVIYQMTKQSSHPTLRATTITPAPHGEGYSYVVEKFWLVREIRPDGKLVVQTRRGKTRLLSPDDPRLRRASWWHRWVHHDRFPQLNELTNSPQEKQRTPQNRSEVQKESLAGN